MSANVQEVTDATFEAEVLQSDKPVVVDFWAEWCGPCRMVAPEIEKLAAKYAGTVEVRKLDVDANPQTAMKYGIMSIPTVALFAPRMFMSTGCEHVVTTRVSRSMRANATNSFALLRKLCDTRTRWYPRQPPNRPESAPRASLVQWRIQSGSAFSSSSLRANAA